MKLNSTATLSQLCSSSKAKGLRDAGKCYGISVHKHLFPRHRVIDSVRIRPRALFPC